MTEFHDPDLPHELARLSGPYPDDNAAFAAWQRRVGQVRRRRVVAWTTTAALAVVVGTVAVAALQSPRRDTVVPGKSADSSIEVRVRISSTQAEVSSTVPQEAESETSPSPTSAMESAPSAAEASLPSTGAPQAAGAASNGSSSGQSRTPSTHAPQKAHVLTQTFSSLGGSITVRNDGEKLTVIAESQVPGFRAKHADRSGEKVQITFESRDHTSQITVKLVNGSMTPDIKESDHDRRHPSSVPSTTEGTHNATDGDGKD
jgi:hypothetical protein